MIVFSEFRRGASSSFLENPVEIRDIVESAMIADLDHRHGAVGKQT